MRSACVVVAALLLAAAAVGAYDTDADAYVMTPGSGRDLQTETCRQPNNAGAEQVRDPVQWLVQFSTAVTDATLHAFAESVRCESGPVHADMGTMICVGDGSVLDRALQFPGVLRVTERPVSARVAPGTPDLGYYYVKCVGDCEPVTRALSRVRAVYRLTRAKLLVWPGMRNLMVLRQSPHVMWIERKPQWKALNAGGRDVLTQGIKTSGYNRSESRTTTYLRGEGQIVSVADTGIDMNNCFFAQPGGAPINTVDMSRPKVVAHLVGQCNTCGGEFGCSGLCADGADKHNGHGTHVAGSVAGRAPGPPQNTNNGIAPLAKLIIQDIEDDQQMMNTPDELGQLFEPAYNLGSRIHTNSWGCSLPEGSPPDACNVYGTSEQEIDEFVKLNPEMLVLFAAGNDGTAAPSGTVGSPATCKNCLAVGATVLDPAQNMEAIQDMNPYTAICWMNPDTPCCSTPQGCTLADCCAASSDCCPEIYNTFATSQLAGFSSTGPTRDGRYKPDLACPGQNIASAHAFSQATSTFCTPGGDHGLPVNSTSYGNRATTVMSGTSMSTPLMAGAAALIREYFSKGFYPTGRATENGMNVTSALVRALLIASATPVTRIHTSEGVKSVSQWSGDQGPYAGFGVPSLDRVLYFADSPVPTKAMIVNGAVDQTTPEYVYSVQISPGTAIPTSIVLVWTDPEGRPGSIKQLVNDLDLIVVLPGNHHLYGNGRSFADTLNTVEKVVVSPDGNTTLTVVVKSAVLRSSSQAFSLVASGAIVSFGPLQAYDFDLKTGRAEHQNASSELVTDNSQCFSDSKMRLQCVSLPLTDHHIPESLLEWRMHLAQVMHLPLSSVQYNTTTQALCTGCNLHIVDETHLRYQSPELVLDNVIKLSTIPESFLHTDIVLARANWSVFAIESNTTDVPYTTAIPSPGTTTAPSPVSSGADRLVPGLMLLLLPIVMRAYEL